MKSSDLFDKAGHAESSQKITEWRLATNHLNLFFMLGAGLILPSNAFGDKYYSDSLSVAPGWLPLFTGKPADGLIEHCCSEASHLIPCIVVLNLSSLSGPVHRWAADGSVQSEMFESAEFDDSDWLMLKAPLPLGCIERIEVRDMAAKKALLDSAKDLRNVDLYGFDMRARKPSFSPSKERAWSEDSTDLERVELNMSELGAVGAFLALCVKLADRSENLSYMYDFFVGGEVKAGIAPLLSVIGDWLHCGSPGEDLNQSAKLLWDLHSAIQGDEDDSLNSAVVTYLERLVPGMDGKAKVATQSLVDDLRGIERLTEKTEQELLAAHNKPLSRALILAFLHTEFIDFLEFDKVALGDEEFLIAAFLLASSQGWLQMPEQLRNIPGLHPAISFKMAEFAHRMLGSGLDLGPVPAFPRSLRKLFEPGKSGLSKSQRQAAVKIAKEMSWDIIQTHIRLPKGSYDLQVTPRGLHLRIPGEADVVELVVDGKELLERLGSTVLPSSLEAETRSKLGA